jgi:dihydrodipicolinate synthase/N-acetylneuraminate lyase
MLADLLAEPNIVVVKDSSQQVSRRDAYLKGRAARPSLRLFSGGEFDTVEYLAAGYDGLLLGGGIFNARMALQILAAVRANDWSRRTRCRRA